MSIWVCSGFFSFLLLPKNISAMSPSSALHLVFLVQCNDQISTLPSPLDGQQFTISYTITLLCEVIFSREETLWKQFLVCIMLGKTAPTPTSEASTSKTNGLEESGWRKTGAEVNRWQRCLNAWMASGLKTKGDLDDLLRAVIGAIVEHSLYSYCARGLNFYTFSCACQSLTFACLCTRIRLIVSFLCILFMSFYY